MAPKFNLWNLFQHKDYYEFDVTQADSDQLQSGTEAWIRHCMVVAGVDVPIGAWQIHSFKSYYYSDYPTDKEWDARWSMGWTVRVFPEGKIQPLSNDLFYAPLSILHSDPTWDETSIDANLDRIAFVIVDYMADATFVEQQCEALLAQAQLDYAESHAEIRRYGPQLHQLRLRLVGDLFPDQARQLDALVELFKAGSGVTNWRDRLTWLDQKPQITSEMQAWLDQFGSRGDSK